MFCSCASIGQVLLFALVKEFGSLVWVTISVTRQLFTILLSVVVFKHSVNFMQWIAISLVFLGLGLDIIMNYLAKDSPGSTKSAKPLAIDPRARSKKDDDYEQDKSFSSRTALLSPSTLERGSLTASTSEDELSPHGMKFRKDTTKTE